MRVLVIEDGHKIANGNEQPCAKSTGYQRLQQS